MRSLLTFDQLRVIVAIDRHGSLASAATSLHLSQPTLSHHVSALEAAIGAKLVERGPRGSQLTELGHLTLMHARVILDRADAAHRDIHDHVAYGTTTLRVGTFPSAGAALVVPALVELAKNGVRYELVIGESEEVSAKLHDRLLHAAILATDPDAAPVLGDDVEVDVLLDDRLLVVVPESHRLAGERRPIALSQLVEERWISPTNDDPEHTVLMHAFELLGARPDIAARVDDFAVSHALVARSQGVALHPSLALGQLGAGVVALQVDDPPLRRRILAAWHASPPASALTEFLEQLRAGATEHTTVFGAPRERRSNV